MNIVLDHCGLRVNDMHNSTKEAFAFLLNLLTIQMYWRNICCAQWSFSVKVCSFDIWPTLTGIFDRKFIHICFCHVKIRHLPTAFHFFRQKYGKGNICFWEIGPHLYLKAGKFNWLQYLLRQLDYTNFFSEINICLKCLKELVGKQI